MVQYGRIRSVIWYRFGSSLRIRSRSDCELRESSVSVESVVPDLPENAERPCSGSTTKF